MKFKGTTVIGVSALLMAVAMYFYYAPLDDPYLHLILALGALLFLSGLYFFNRCRPVARWGMFSLLTASGMFLSLVTPNTRQTILVLGLDLGALTVLNLMYYTKKLAGRESNMNG